VPFDDDAEADNPGFRPPPHPDDRLWRHPSEMRAHPIAPIDGEGPRPAPPQIATPRGDRQRVRPWGAVVAAGTAGAVLAGVGVAVLGVGERVIERPVTERVALDPTASALEAPATGATEGVRQRTAPTMVGVEPAGSEGGSGIVVRDDGIVITSAAFVVAGAVPVVRLPNGRTPRVDLVGTDATTGLAVLDLAGRGYTPSILATGEDLVAGRSASALGGGGSAGVTTTDGVIGDAERYVGPQGTDLDGVEVEGDAETSDLGGAVTDQRGAVLGVTTAVADGEAWYVVPVAVVDRVADDLLTDGVARHCRLGIEGTEPGPDAPASSGTLVASVVPESPAALGGIRPGDVIVGLDDEEVADMADLIVRLRAHSPGDRVEVTVERADESRASLLIRLDDAPADIAA
jgi:putative serine protease PepD